MKKCICLLLFLSLQTAAHPHHHSLAIITYNTDDQQFELSLKLLSEDYQTISSKQGLESYLNAHLKINPNDKNLKGKLIGQEKSYEFVWLYFTYKFSMPKLVKSLIVKNTVLLEINESQFNTVKINFLGQQQAHNFSGSEKRYVFEFK